MTPQMEQSILNELREIKREVITIKAFILDEDMVLTKEEKGMVDEAMEEYKKNKTLSVEEVEKRLGM